MNIADITRLTTLALALGTGACSANDTLPIANEYGAQPSLTAPDPGLLPTVKPAKAVGWQADQQPTAAPGLAVNAFARDLDHPRWLLVLGNGDVLVAESRAPQKSGGFSGIKGWIASKMMSYAGAGGVSADRITLLRDTDGDGAADLQTVLVENLHSPIGMAVVGDYLYVANTDALIRFPYSLGATRIDAKPEHIVNLPHEPLNHHWTKNLIASADGTTLYVAVGSNSNIAENGLAAEQDRAAILAVDPESGTYKVHAHGLRNPVGLAFEPSTGQLWTAVNERDELGDQLVPDYITSVTEGGFYGWPWSYWGQHIDDRVTPQNPEAVAKARSPDYAVGAHTASLGLAFYDHNAINTLAGAAIVGQHGSWNRSPRSGYKVIAVPFVAGKPEGLPVDILTGFLSEDGDARGRPAGVAVDSKGAILVADDVGNVIWRVAAHSLTAQAEAPYKH